MIPNREVALNELKVGEFFNPGPWIKHSINTGRAAEAIAGKIKNLDKEKAYILGIMHDIGKRNGIALSKVHVIEGYRYCISQNWNEIAKVCMTHSYPIKEKEFYYPVNGSDDEFIREYIQKCKYDDYDLLIQLCDSLALPEGCCLLEKRFVDVAIRYGVGDTTVERWQKLFEIKDYFEQKIGTSVYDLLPEVREVSFSECEKWVSPVFEKALLTHKNL